LVDRAARRRSTRLRASLAAAARIVRILAPPSCPPAQASRRNESTDRTEYRT
jgi:hypothetical protein